MEIFETKNDKIIEHRMVVGPEWFDLCERARFVQFKSEFYDRSRSKVMRSQHMILINGNKIRGYHHEHNYAEFGDYYLNKIIPQEWIRTKEERIEQRYTKTEMINVIYYNKIYYQIKYKLSSILPKELVDEIFDYI
jgi:hypothetical protein